MRLKKNHIKRIVETLRKIRIAELKRIQAEINELNSKIAKNREAMAASYLATGPHGLTEIEELSLSISQAFKENEGAFLMFHRGFNEYCFVHSEFKDSLMIRGDYLI